MLPEHVAASLQSVLQRDIGWRQLPNSSTLRLKQSGKPTYYVGWDGDFFQCCQGGERVYGYVTGDAAADEAEQLHRYGHGV